MRSNLHLKKIEVKVRSCGSQPSICVRTFTLFTNKPFPWLFRFYKQTDHVQSDAKVWVAVIRASASSDTDITYETANII